MKALDIYYQVKPIIPRSLQIAVRRAIATRKKRAAAGVWPIDPGAAKPPSGWPGWPGNKRFALVLHHDVDSLKGLERSLRLMELERRMGYKSSFNFVPEDYPTPLHLIQAIASAGFEVGVHGLRHDGKLFRRPGEFCAKVPRIDRYLKKWKAVGFTSPSMLRKLSWIAELDIEHSCSTFDTDPFEPQSEGVGTIFPFVAANESGTRAYIEIPYTLPQDHGLFIILRENSIDIWKRKVDWIVENGGMVTLNSHPDYMAFDSADPGPEEYPVTRYIELLDYIQARYAGQYWHALPRDMARFWRKAVGGQKPLGPKNEKPLPADCNLNGGLITSAPRTKIWIDLDNTPHVPFFIPIIRELERRGHKVVLTARDAFQVCELAEAKGLNFGKIGRHYGKNPVLKVAGLAVRSFELLPFYARQRPGLALSHGARSMNLLANLLGVPTVLIADYEHARTAPFTHPRWTIVPEALSPRGLPSPVKNIRYYRGIKEDVYAPDFKPDPGLPRELGLLDDRLVVTVRPPADEAHYYNPESDVLFHELMDRICGTDGIRAVVLPRNVHQERHLRAEFPAWFEGGRTIVPGHAIDGLDLIWISDLVVSGGGTMNREAAALGVPVYSIFRGTPGAVDLELESQGRLTMIRDKEEVWSKIAFVRRDKSRPADNTPRAALEDIIEHIEDIIRIERA
jgi:predicted glycosyltransferase